VVLYNNKYSPLFTKIFGHFAVFSFLFCSPSCEVVTVVLDACLDTVVTDDGVIDGIDLECEYDEAEGVDNSFTPLPVTTTPGSIGGGLNDVDDDTEEGTCEELVVMELLPVAIVFDEVIGGEEIVVGVSLKLDGELATGTELFIVVKEKGELATGAELGVGI